MNKNGAYFAAVIGKSNFVSTSWDPYVYQPKGEGGTLSEYASVAKIAARQIPYGHTRFRPIEYRDLPGGDYLSFSLERENALTKKSVAAVDEETILFGTMRAYLGNITVTPQAEWINCKSPAFYETKSEFVAVKPYDGLTYFWLAYLRSPHFLRHLPLGSGGTRPRLHASALDAVPVSVPDLQVRQNIHNKLQDLARHEWETHFETTATMKTIIASL